MRVGIFFGGQSREREISFAGGRTVYDNLNKSLFDAVPIFIDSLGNFIHLDWKYIYKGTIRDFYPPVASIPKSKYSIQVYAESLKGLSDDQWDDLINQVGKRIQPNQLSELIDFAFLALHGPYGEDGNIQGLLEWYNIPYSGAGILPSAIGINKIIQKKLLEQAGFDTPYSEVLSRQSWEESPIETIYEHLKSTVGLPLVIKSPHQGSSIGVSIHELGGLNDFKAAIQKSFFIKEIDAEEWHASSDIQKTQQIALLVDIREGIGLPVIYEEQFIYTVDNLFNLLDGMPTKGTIKLAAAHAESELLIEAFIEGKEFSCIVIQDEQGRPIALPPTEIRKGSAVFDYRSKYLPGMSRKVTPIDAPLHVIENIRKSCSELFQALQINVYARIDGFINTDNKVFLNDPNTTSGMLPSSFFFHQAAEIGLNPSQFLSYIIRTSLSERLKTGKAHFENQKKLALLDKQLSVLKQQAAKKINVAVIMGGFSTERHISVESGRNIYEKLASSDKYLPIPIFLTGSEAAHALFVLPVNIMLKDNADDIKEKVSNPHRHPVLEQIAFECREITNKYAADIAQPLKQINYQELASMVDVAFIALHGRPGEDGAVQRELEELHIPYNGSGVESSQITINKYDTNELLRKNGISVAKHALVYQNDWEKDTLGAIQKIEHELNYPLIAKPADDGCSSAVKKIKNQAELAAFAAMMFRPQVGFPTAAAATLKLKPTEEFPQKNFFLVEELIEKQSAAYFLEITGGLLTYYTSAGAIAYEIFEPSEALASGEVLSLEEKFLAGEGQNITPARYTNSNANYAAIAEQVKATLKKTAELLDIQGYARIDAFVRIFDDLRVETIIIEVNSLPGMTPATCIFHQTAINGYKPYEFIDNILTFGMQRTKKQLATNEA